MYSAAAHVHSFLNLSDTPASFTGQGGKVLKVKSDDTGVEFADEAAGADEKVKYNASDAAAGYLADKIVAGTGITLEEGTGGDAYKLKISATGVGLVTPPASATDTGTIGWIACDGNWWYYCYDTNKWSRTPMAKWWA